MPAQRVRRLALILLVVLIAGCAGRSTQPPVTVGATPDLESVLLAHVYAGALRSSGAAAQVQTAADPVAMLDSGALTVVPGFTGRLLAVFAPGAAARSDRPVYRAMVGALPEGIAAGDYATAATDKPALAITKATATAWGGTDLAVLPRHCDRLTVGGVSGARPPSAVGRCRLPAVREFPDDKALFAALRAARIVAAWTSTADPGVPADVVVLTDGKPALVRAENVVPLYRRNELAEPQLLALNQVAGVLDTEALVDMRRQLADGADPQAVADAWLSEHPLGR
ncbi:MAG TPA: glycine betaine ABC transporter substrate-binding protein [Mycobacterium sp.]|nr:glycine betaine ABC transporter substrate-binding protein [Mycobacterium sp.]